jgi:uncharacterized membrane protein YgcG
LSSPPAPHAFVSLPLQSGLKFPSIKLPLMKDLFFSISISILMFVTLRYPFKFLLTCLGLDYIYIYVAFVFVVIALFVKFNCYAKDVTSYDIRFAAIFFILFIILDYFGFYSFIIILFHDILNPLKDQIITALKFTYNKPAFYSALATMVALFKDKFYLPMGMGGNPDNNKTSTKKRDVFSNSLNMNNSSSNASGSSGGNGSGSSGGTGFVGSRGTFRDGKGKLISIPPIRIVESNSLSTNQVGLVQSNTLSTDQVGVQETGKDLPKSLLTFEKGNT